MEDNVYKLTSLYKTLLHASSYHDNQDYQDISYINTRNVFSEFDITAYFLYGSCEHFIPPLNSSTDRKTNIRKIKQFLQTKGSENEYLETGRNAHCECGIRIIHQFEVTNRMTNKKVFPIGRICIMKFADTTTLEIMKDVGKAIYKYTCSIEKQKRQIELNLMRLEDKPLKKLYKKVKRTRKVEIAECKLMRLEDKVVKRKKTICNYDCNCKLIASINSVQLDPLLFDIDKINSKQYMNDYMKALGLKHCVTYV